MNYKEYGFENQPEEISLQTPISFTYAGRYLFNVGSYVDLGTAGFFWTNKFMYGLYVSYLHFGKNLLKPSDVGYLTYGFSVRWGGK